MKIGTLHNNGIEHFLAHRNPIKITNTIYREIDQKVIQFTVEFDDGISLSAHSPIEGVDVQLQYENFLELIRLSKLAGKQVIQN